jgi:hypothetical protein
MRAPFLSALLLVFAFSTLDGQDKLVVDDRAGLLNDTVETVLREKLMADSLSYTNMVDFRDPCAYYYASLEVEGRDLILSITDCNKQLIGARNLGTHIMDASNVEQGLLLSYGMLDLIAQPGKYLLYGSGEGPAGSGAAGSGQPIPRDSALANEHDSRYFFAPSARNLKQGELYYNTVYFLLHDIQYGVTDNFSMGIGTSIIGMPVYLTPKVSIPLGVKSTLAIGDMPILGTYGTGFFGNLAYGVYTYGGSDGNVSLGAGHLYINENELTNETSSLVTNFSAMARISPYMFYLTENYVMSAVFPREAYGGNTVEEFEQRNTFWYGMMGVRIVSKNRDFISWQIGLTYVVNFPGEIDRKYNSWDHNAPEEARLVAFPTVTFTVKFGKGF